MALNTVKQASDKIICTFIIFLIPIFTYPVNTVKSPVNNKILPQNPNRIQYVFFAGGHLYGYPSTSIFVAPSLLSSINEINKNKPHFFVSLGDNYRNADSLTISVFKQTFAEKLNCPFFITVGNHDVSKRAVFNSFFGNNTWYSFYYSNDIFIFLDSEIDDGKIVAEQLNFLKTKTKEIIDNNTIKNVFIFCHKLIWTIQDTTFKIVYENTNDVNGYKYNDNFLKEVFPLIQKMALNHNVYFMSGDIGVELKNKRYGFPLFYHKVKNTNITYIANGIGDNNKDLILKIDVDIQGNVKINTFALTPYEWKNIENYGLNFWKSFFKNKPNYPSQNVKIDEKNFSVIRKIKNIITNKYFYSGLFIGLILMSFLFLIKKKNNEKTYGPTTK